MKIKFFLLLLSQSLLPIVQAAKQLAVWLSLDCVNRKYLWALPTPTTFEKVDQTFIITKKNFELLKNINIFEQRENFEKLQHFFGFVEFFLLFTGQKRA